MDAESPKQAPKKRIGGRTRPAGLKEIAAFLDLSPATVSMVINNVPLAKSMSAETRARVLAAAKQFNYRPNLIARALSKRESRTIGVIAPESSDGYFTRVMRGVEAAMLDAGYQYFTTSHLGRSDLIREYPIALTQRGVDGLIFVNTPVLEDPDIPAVSITGVAESANVTSILVDQRQGMFDALQHLVSLGHSRILLMRGPDWCLDANDRFRALMEAAQRLDLPTPPELLLTLEANQLGPELLYRRMLQVLKRRNDFSAVFAFNDVAALGTLRAMQDLGLRCPEDLSLLGVDDVSTSAYLMPRLSTSAQPLEDMGRAAVERLVARIQAPDAEHPAQVTFPMSLQIRDSTGPAHRSDTPAQPDTRQRLAGLAVVAGD